MHIRYRWSLNPILFESNSLLIHDRGTNPSILMAPSFPILQPIKIHLPDQYTYKHSLIQENRAPLFHFNMISRNLEEIYQKWSELYTSCEHEINFYLYSFLVSFEMKDVKFVENYDLMCVIHKKSPDLYPKEAHNTENLISVCSSCVRKAITRFKELQ